MSPKQIENALDLMLSNNKSRSFLNHLVKSYIPIKNVSLLTKEHNTDFKCVLTKEKLMLDIEFISLLEDKNKDSVSNYLVSIEKAIRFPNELYNQKIYDAKLGVTGKQTTTQMSFETFQIFNNWVVNKSLDGDKHINWLLGSIRRSNSSNKKSNKPLTKKSGITLGESSNVLLKLKESFELNNK